MDRVKIRILRQMLGMTQLELANAIKVEPICVSRWETGKSKPSRASLKELMRLAGEDSPCCPCCGRAWQVQHPDTVEEDHDS